jgi:uncharacterized protein
MWISTHVLRVLTALELGPATLCVNRRFGEFFVNSAALAAAEPPSPLACPDQSGTLVATKGAPMTKLPLFLSLACALLLPSALAAECQGRNLIAAMPAAAQADLRAKAEAVPYAVGNFWRATRGTEVIHLIGTYHFDDPRHDATMQLLDPILTQAKTLLVEAGPAEEESLKARIADDPSLIINTDGPTLPEVMAPDDWTRLSDAVKARGLPAFMVAKFRPWYVSMLLSIPPCGLETAAEPNGLDTRLIRAAHAAGVPVKALEPYDTVFGIFKGMSQTEQIDMLTSALAIESVSADMTQTLADSYFNQEGRLIWEFNRAQTLAAPGYTPERVDAEMAVMEQSMMIKRNHAWIPVIEAEAEKGPLMVGFGALHLSGNEGVLRLLENDGYKIERLALP